MPEWFLQLGLMGWPLAFCSLLAIAVVLERSTFYIKALMQKEATYQHFKACLVEHKTQPKATRDEMVSVLLDELQPSFYNGLKLLRIVGTLSPMLGLLGTILGIISAFRVIASQTGPVTPNMIADGLWEAMLTTAAGLFIALPSLLMAHFFRSLSERMLGDLCFRLNKLSLDFELGHKQEGSSSSTKRPVPANASFALKEEAL